MEPEGKLAVGGVLALLLVVAGGMAGCPVYKVWTAQMEGRALLAHAQFSKEVAVAEAKAKEESAAYLARAEVTRAEGVAKANKIIGASLQNNEAYLRYLWISEMATTQNQLIYIPTEAGMPILEAGRRIAARP